MTHFMIGIVVPPNRRRNIERYIQRQLAPYDEGRFGRRNNPAGKWDYWEIGGRWNGWLTDADPEKAQLQDNIAPVEHVVAHGKLPFALVTPEGVWHERGDLCTVRGILDDIGKDVWDLDASSLLKHYAGHMLVLVDAHV